MVDEVKDQIIDLIGCKDEDILLASGKTGQGVEDILEAIIERIPAPKGDPEAPLQALIFDSVFNPFRGIIAYFKIVNGTIKPGDFVKFVATGKEYDADEIGVLKLDMAPRKELSAGNVGYIISGIKTSKEVKVGDTITHVAKPCDKAIEGFEEVKPMVFAGVYPIETEDYENLRASLEKLQLNDASLTFQPESSAALGFGFRCGFLGLLHMEIVQERLSREFDMEVITTVPNVSYKVYDKKGFRFSGLVASGLLIAGFVLLLFTRTTLPVFFGSLLMMCGYLAGMAVFGAKIRELTPAGKAGMFQGVRIFSQVLVPGIVGPWIGKTVLANAETILNNDGTESFVPSADIFLAALVAAGVLAVALLLTNIKKQKGKTV
jgi:hypothetical protein